MSVSQANQSVSSTSELALLVADTDGTQSYVFESSKLPEIRGASLQLDTLNAQIGQWVRDRGGDLIYANGGGLLALAPPPVAQALATDIEAHYPQETGGATVTAVACPLPPDYDDREFSRYVTWAMHVLKRRKESKPAPPFFETLPHQARCRSCQQRPALAGNVEEWCAVCLQKRRFRGRDAWFEQFLDYPGSAYNQVQAGVQVPQDLGELGQVSRPKQDYVAFIYLDGDGIGQLLQQKLSREQYYKLSEKLRDVTETAVFDALAQWLQPAKITGSPSRRESSRPDLAGQEIFIHPFEIITIGGDDVMLIVPAHAAIPIALQIGQTFAQQMTPFVQKELNIQRQISMSGGIVIAESHTPVRLLRDLAHQLQDEAKKLEGGALDYHILKSADMLAAEVETVREQYPYLLAGYGRSGRDLRLLARPYTYDQLDALWQGLCQLKADNFPTSQMHRLADSLLEGKASATLFFEYQSHRARHERSAYQTLNELLVSLQQPAGAEPDPESPLPWRKAASDADYSHDTNLWDVAELYDFVP